MKVVALTPIVLLAASASAQFAFGEVQAEFLSAQPHGIAVADFNNDAILDFAVSMDNVDKVEIYVNDGTGRFTIHGSPIFLGSNLGPRDIVTLDFDLDGDKDLAVAISRFDSVRFLINDGQGNFSFGPTTPTGLLPTRMAAGRLNSGDEQDLVVLNRDSGTVSVLLRAGGGFTETAYPVGIDPRDIDLGDFDFDGDLDFAVSNLLTADITVWYNTGEGLFSGRLDLPTIHPFLPYDLEAKDIDNDGDVDITAAGWGDDGSNNRVYGTTVFRSNGTGFDAPVFYSLRLWAGLEHEFVTLGDFDSDGDNDLVGLGNANGTLDFLVNDGGGNFAPGYEDYGGNPVTEMQNHDLNGDLKPDLIMSHGVSGGGIGAHVDYFMNETPGNWLQLPPSNFQMARGRIVNGTLESLSTSNNQYLVTAPGPTLAVEAPIQVVADATSPLASPTRLKIGIELHAAVTGVRRTLEIYNFGAGAWQAVNVETASRGDEMLWFDLPAAGLVEPGTQTVRARVSLRSTRPVLSYPWMVRLDRIAWAVK